MNKKAFTLFELMVVVMIIGIVYSLVLGNFNTKNRVSISSIENIKKALMPHWKKGHKVDLIVYDKCSKSILAINNEPMEDLELNLNNKIFKNIKVYKNDLYNDKRSIAFPSIKIENKIYKSCFRFSIFPNGSSSSYIVKSENKFYLFFPIFVNTLITNDLDSAMEIYTNEEFTKITVHE